MSGRVPTAGEEATLEELQRLLTGADTGRVAVLREGRLAGVVTREGSAPQPDRRGRGGERPRPVDLRPAGGARPAGQGIRGDRGGQRAVRRRLPRRRDDPRHPPRRGELRRRHRGRGRRDRAGRADRRSSSTVASARTRSSAPPSSVYGERRANRRRHRAHRVLRRSGGAARRSSTPRSGRICSAATSRSTRWRRRSRAATSGGSSIRSAGCTTSTERRIRVLHNLSFIEDPTRIFRAIRYENRYGFRMDEHTLRLARGCIDMGLVGDLSSSRLRDELVALLEEREVRHTILRLGELGADRAIHPHLAADDEAVRLAGAARRAEGRAARRVARLAPPPGRPRAAAPARRDLRWLGAPRRPPPRRRADRLRGHGRAPARRAARRQDVRSGRGRVRSRSRTRPTRRCSRSPSPTCPRCATTSPASGTSGSTSAGGIWRCSAWPSRRGWGRCSPSSAGASCAAGWTGGSRSWRRRAS